MNKNDLNALAAAIAPAQENTVPVYDRQLGSLHGLPDVLSTKPSTMTVVGTLGIGTETWITQTYRQREVGDYIFVQCITGSGSMRFVIPPKVADALARQRDQLSTASRKKAAKAVAQDRKDKGILPGFMKGKKRK